MGAGPGIVILLALALGGVALIAASMIDLEQHRIPNAITYPAMGLCVIAGIVGVAVGEDSRAIAAAVGSAAFGLLLYIPHRITPASMGLGDVKLALSLGFAIGWTQAGTVEALLAVGWSLAAASAFGLVMAAMFARSRGERLRSGQEVPFGPALSLATLLAVVVGTF